MEDKKEEKVTNEYATLKNAQKAYVVVGDKIGGGLLYAKALAFIIQNALCDEIEEVMLYSMETELDSDSIIFFIEDPFGKMPYLSSQFFSTVGPKLYKFLENGGNVYSLSSMDFSINRISNYNELLMFGYNDVQVDYINRLTNNK